MKKRESFSDLLSFSLSVLSFLLREITSDSLLKVFLSVAPHNESETGYISVFLSKVASHMTTRAKVNIMYNRSFSLFYIHMKIFRQYLHHYD